MTLNGTSISEFIHIHVALQVSLNKIFIEEIKSLLELKGNSDYQNSINLITFSQNIVSFMNINANF